MNNSPIISGSLLAIAWSSSFAGGPPGTVSLEQDWILRAGGEVGHDQSRGSSVSLDYKQMPDAMPPADPESSWSGGLSGLHTDAPAQSGGTVTTGGEIYARYGSDTVSGGLAFDSTRDNGFRRSPRWTATLDLGGYGLTSELSVSTRRTTFDSFSTAVPNSGGPPLSSSLVNTTAACNLRDTGYGLNVGYSAAGWAGYAFGAGSHFDSIRCGYGLGVAGAPGQFDRGGFQQFSHGFTDQGAARAGGQIGQSTRLLQSSVGAGLSRQWDREAIALDYTRSKDEFGGTAQDGYAITGSAKLATHIAADLSLGTTVSDSKSAPYIGAYFSVGFGSR